MWSLIIALGCASGALNLFPFTHCQASQRRLAKDPSIPYQTALPHPQVRGWVTLPASPINLATCLAVLAHYLRERLSSLWLCRPVHILVPLVPRPNQTGQCRNYSGPQLCAESVWMSIAWGTSLETVTSSASALADDRRMD